MHVNSNLLLDTQIQLFPFTLNITYKGLPKSLFQSILV
ncbi:hypothetical protein BVRB_7g157760 [Beta vulgaris subsp. vulgaris]|nr:hypothetical protein BVRB_7g157760 [Beta vulgaris subsp. vulgaris]